MRSIVEEANSLTLNWVKLMANDSISSLVEWLKKADSNSQYDRSTAISRLEVAQALKILKTWQELPKKRVNSPEMEVVVKEKIELIRTVLDHFNHWLSSARLNTTPSDTDFYAETAMLKIKEEVASLKTLKKLTEK